MKAFHFFFILSVLTFFAACNEPKDRVRIEGEISGIKSAEFYVYSDDGLMGGVDTIKVARGEFVYDHPLSQPMILTILYPNFSRTQVIVEPGEKLKIRGEASRLGAIDVSGSKENELLTKFRQQNFTNSEKDQQMAAAQFIRDHSSSMAAVAVFKRYFGQAFRANAIVALPLLDALKTAHPKNMVVKLMDEQYRAAFNTSEGKYLPEFSALTLKGDTVTHGTFKNKPFLAIFWYPWEGNSYRLMKCVHRLEKDFKDKLGILLVSIDYNMKNTKNRIEQESVTSPVVCDERGFYSPLVNTFGIRYIPGNMLVGADGEIFKREVPLADLEKEVADWLK